MFSFPMAAMRQLNIPQVGRGEHGGALPYRFDTGACVRGICFIAKWSPRLPTPTTFTPQISQLDLSNGSAVGELDGRRNLSSFKNTEIGEPKTYQQQLPQTVATSSPATTIIAEQKIGHPRMDWLWPQSTRNPQHRRAFYSKDCEHVSAKFI